MTWQNQQNDYVQRRLRSAWASAQSDQSLRCSHEETLGPYLPSERRVKTLFRLGGCLGWSESLLDAQSLCWFCHVVAHMYFPMNRLYLVSLFVKDNSVCRFRNEKITFLISLYFDMTWLHVYIYYKNLKMHQMTLKQIWTASSEFGTYLLCEQWRFRRVRSHAVSPEPMLLAHTSSESRGTFRKKARSLAPLNGWACAVTICHDRMLKDTNSLDGAHLYTSPALPYLLVSGKI